MEILIETPRLIIRELQPEDAEGMFAMDSDPEVHRYLGNRPIKSLEEIPAIIAQVRRQYEEHGIGRWAVLLKESREFVGWTGFKRMTEPVNGQSGHLDFGYRNARKFWRQGYAFEAARAALAHGIGALGFTDIYATADAENIGSRRILEKLGFTFIKIFPYDAPPEWRAEMGKPTAWYELTSSAIAAINP